MALRRHVDSRVRMVRLQRRLNAGPHRIPRIAIIAVNTMLSSAAGALRGAALLVAIDSTNPTVAMGEQRPARRTGRDHRVMRIRYGPAGRGSYRRRRGTHRGVEA